MSKTTPYFAAGKTQRSAYPSRRIVLERNLFHDFTYRQQQEHYFTVLVCADVHFFGW
jgi:hypothetical protein